MLSLRFCSAAARVLPLVLASVLAAYPVAAQQPSPTRMSRDTLPQPRRAPETPAQENRDPLPAAPLLDRPVVRSEYRLGPGDVVNVAVFGEAEMATMLAVTPEGTLVIPSVGVVRVLGANLDEAQARVRTAVFRLYRNVDVTLSLTQVRTFKVFLVGDVPNPGVVTASSVTRASEVIPTGGERATPPALGPTTLERTGLSPHRNILLRRATGDSVLVDLARFALLGDLSANPTLREGDALVVRTVTESVQITGPVGFPGVYEYREGESLADFLALTTGGRGLPRYAGDTIRVSRVGPTGARRTIFLSGAEASGRAGAALPLEPFDVVYVQGRSRFAQEVAATVQGEVRNPGTYPIRLDTTTVRELIAAAGGFTDRASLAGATLRRQPVQNSRVTNGEDLAPDSALTPAELSVRRLEAATSAEASFVVLELDRVFAPGGEAYDVTLESGDLLHIPERRGEVAVIGAVMRPGLVRHAQGLTVDQYVNLAGGYLRRAAWKDATVLRANSGARLSVREVSRIEPGDRIVVPFRERRTLLERLQTTQTITAIVSGLILTIVTLSRL
jgi:protein involved in polysaccharide export with SLBB domain